MLREISSEQLWEWMAFAELEPFGEDREDYRTGAVVAAIYNVNKKKGSKRLEMSECRPIFGDAKSSGAKITDWRAMKAIHKAMAASNANAVAPKRKKKNG